MDTLKDKISLMLKGGVIGVANIIPGVSGGTMAVVLGIYEKLIEAIGNLATDKEKRKDYIIFLGIVGMGAAAAIVILSWLMDFLLTDYPIYTYLFFIGLIAGSIPSIYKTHDDMDINGSSILTFLLGMATILAFVFLFLEVEKSKDINFEYQLTAAGIGLLFLSGILAGGSMIVPGISGSFILVLLGQYRVIIKAIKEFDVLLIGIVAAGAGAGIWGFAKLIDFLLKRYPKQTMYFILGLVVASLYPIFPGLPEGGGATALAILIGISGFAVAFLLGARE